MTAICQDGVKLDSYFRSFNYSLANEDSSVERALARDYHSPVVIGGSGIRALSLLSPHFESLQVVDVSRFQILYARLQWELAQQLTYENFCQVMGYQDLSLALRVRQLKELSFSSEVRQLLGRFPRIMIEEGLIYGGRWESYLLKVSSLIRRTSRHDFSVYFETKDLSEQQHLFETCWPRKRLSLLMRLFANPVLMNRLLYRGQMAKASDENLISFLEGNFENVFRNFPLKKSFFHQLLFLGKLSYPEAYPLQTEIWPDLQSCAKKVQFLSLDLLSAMESLPGDFWSCSDVVSYFSAQDLHRLAEAMSLRLKWKIPQRVVFRSFLRHPVLGPYPGWASRADLALEAADRDSTQLYRFQIFDSLH